MYEIDGICYAGERQESIKISSARYIAEKMLLVKFSTGESRLFDAEKLSGSAFMPLNDDAVFRAFEIRHGVLTWDNGEIDIAPEFVYDESYPYETKNPINAREAHA